MDPQIFKIAALRRESVRIRDEDNVDLMLRKLCEDGSSNLQVISDFDNTLTRVHFNGESCHSTYGILDSSPLLPEESRAKSRKIREVYRNIEVDPYMSPEQKIPLMLEWYRQSHDLLIASNIYQSDFSKMVAMSRVMLREGCKSFFQMLFDHKVPLLIMSAGVGNLVEATLKHYDSFYPNMTIVANYMIFDKEGRVNGFQGELIHMYNKNQNSIKNAEYFQRFQERKNLILLGDSLGDLGMGNGMMGMDAVLRLGFLNSRISESLDTYMKGFDIVLLDDQTMDVPNGIVKEIVDS